MIILLFWDAWPSCNLSWLKKEKSEQRLKKASCHERPRMRLDLAKSAPQGFTIEISDIILEKSGERTILVRPFYFSGCCAGEKLGAFKNTHFYWNQQR